MLTFHVKQPIRAIADATRAHRKVFVDSPCTTGRLRPVRGRKRLDVVCADVSRETQSDVRAEQVERADGASATTRWGAVAAGTRQAASVATWTTPAGPVTHRTTEPTGTTPLE
ncbi:hypothetical protein PDTK01_07930 [Phycicoccus sp. DTK01]|nr:hypothetical protein PDTK01_07930 [Phycicoccus sp. DTK01]